MALNYSWLLIVQPRSALRYAAHFCQSEVCNGGFWQFFSNSTGVLSPEAVLGFRAIGQDGVATVVQAAIDEFGLPYPRDRTLRTLRFARSTPNDFDVLDRRFYALIGVEGGGFQTAADNYATQLSFTDLKEYRP
jgi:hypothetical protein